jgi:hypothetical protein
VRSLRRRRRARSGSCRWTLGSVAEKAERQAAAEEKKAAAEEKKVKALRETKRGEERVRREAIRRR